MDSIEIRQYNTEEIQMGFSDYIYEMRKKESEKSGKDCITTKQIAQRLKLSYEQCRKIINLNKLTKNRDCIIAICLVIGMNSNETNSALKKYPKMYLLNSEDNRDRFIKDFLDKHCREKSPYERATIERFNQELISSGFDKLDIIHHRNFNQNKNTSKPKKTEEKVVKKIVQCSADLLFGDQYDSLATEYSVSRYSCLGKMRICANDCKDSLISVSSSINEATIQFSFYNESEFIEYKNLNETGVLQEHFTELLHLVRKETERVLIGLNDTKNYIERVSVKIKDYALYFFAETYNYDFPDVGEYYLYECIGTQQFLKVFRSSQFMKCYLSKQDFDQIYIRSENKLLRSYSSFDELEEEISNNSIDIAPLLRSRLRAFKHLRELSQSLKEDIINHKKYVRRLEYIYDDRDRVCEFFHVEKEFHCVFESEYSDFMKATVERVEFLLPNDEHVVITLQDLYDAFELGYNHIDEICEIKKNTGSVKSVLQF